MPQNFKKYLTFFGQSWKFFVALSKYLNFTDVYVFYFAFENCFNGVHMVNQKKVGDFFKFLQPSKNI